MGPARPKSHTQCAATLCRVRGLRTQGADAASGTTRSMRRGRPQGGRHHGPRSAANVGPARHEATTSASESSYVGPGDEAQRRTRA